MMSFIQQQLARVGVPQQAQIKLRGEDSTHWMNISEQQFAQVCQILSWEADVREDSVIENLSSGSKATVKEMRGTEFVALWRDSNGTSIEQLNGRDVDWKLVKS